MGRYWSRRIESMLGACLRDRDALPPLQSVDVRFQEFMADDVAMVKQIYDVAGLTLTDEARRAMDAFMGAHPRGRHGRVEYHLEDFGLSPTERRAALAGYVERFAVEEESPGSG